MPYVSTAERIGIKIGVKQGESTLLLHLLFHKFKDIPVKYLQKLNNATTKHFLKWSERVLDRSSLEEIFED